jgi:hypothetical protein
VSEGSAQSGSMAVEVACFGNILFLLRRHFRGVLTTWHTARPELFAGDLVLGWSFFFAESALHLTPPLLEMELGS